MPGLTESKAAASWITWLKQRDDIQAELDAITGMHDARTELERAMDLAHHNVLLKASIDPYYPGRFDQRDRVEDIGTLIKLVEQVRADTSNAMRSPDWPRCSAERQAYIQELALSAESAAARLEEASKTLSELETITAEVEGRMEELSKSAPKASNSGITELRKALEAATTERDRIAAALDKLVIDEGPLALARESEQEAAARMEEAEAMLALGEIDGGEVKAAKEAVEKSRQILDKQQIEHRRMEAVSRGLTRKLEQASSHRDELDRVYREVLGRVRAVELEGVEASLVTEMKRVAADHVKRMAVIHADLEEAHPGRDYRRPCVAVKLPSLYYHSANDFEVTPEGEE